MVTYQQLKGRKVTPDEIRQVTDFRKEAQYSQRVNLVTDSQIVRRTMQLYELSLPDAITMLLCEDLGPEHALIERIEAMRIVIADLDSPREALRGAGYKRQCLSLIRRIEELFNVSRTEAYRPNVALLETPFEPQADAVAKAAPAARNVAKRHWPEVQKAVRKAQSSHDKRMRRDPE